MQKHGIYNVYIYYIINCTVLVDLNTPLISKEKMTQDRHTERVINMKALLTLTYQVFLYVGQ